MLDNHGHGSQVKEVSVIVDITVFDITLFAAGWIAGWLLLWRPRPLPSATTVGVSRPAIAVVVPARDEAEALAGLVPSVIAQLRDDDEFVVVDDHSSDGSGQVARGLGAEVIEAAPLPDGWLGKTHACWTGAQATTAPVLLFLDADVQPASDLLDRVAAASAVHPDDVVSVQPWHRTGGAAEQFSLFPSVVALMGAGAFSVFGTRVRTRLAFGPVLALRRAAYQRVGGHADPAIRAVHTEDIALARAAGRARLFTGAPDTSFRMYPAGLRQTVDGWTRSIATGARSTPWWSALAAAAWVFALAGGPIAMPIVYPLCVAQVWVLGRRAISVHPVTALLYPVALAVFVWIFVRSTLAVVFGREVTWKGRAVSARP